VTVTFNDQKFSILRTELVCFVWISEQTAIISLHNINWLVFIAEMESVYCAVRTGYLTLIVERVSSASVEGSEVRSASSSVQSSKILRSAHRVHLCVL